jgi:hypothetical protein
MKTSHEYVDSLPSPQNIAQLFDGEWSSRFPSWSGVAAHPGHADLFNDPRVYWAWDVLGPFDNKDILELGPLEGAHSCMLERLGARSVCAIEANARAFLRCLCVKEIFGLTRVRFELGSFYPYLETCAEVDMIFASGVLYHMPEPLRLLSLLCRRTDRLFIWTHYFDAEVTAGREDRSLYAAPEELDGSGYWGAKRLYPEAALTWQGFSGGSDSYSIWLQRESILRFLDNAGFDVEVNFDQRDHPNGAAFALCARKRNNAPAT